MGNLSTVYNYDLKHTYLSHGVILRIACGPCPSSSLPIPLLAPPHPGPYSLPVRPSLKWSLELLEDMVSAISEERPKPKTLLFKSLSGHMEVLISLLPVFLTQPDMLDQLMSFFLTVFYSLKSQVRVCVCVHVTTFI